jgi:hypothetical protein
MQITPPGAFSRGKITLGTTAPHITPDSLLQELTQQWGPQGFQVYKSALVGVDVALRKSGWTGVAIKIKQTPAGTELVYNAFAPSALVRMMALGLIPILIINAKAWKPLLRAFEQYVQASPFFGGQMQLAQGMPMHGGQPMHAAQPPWQAMQQPMAAQQPMQEMHAQQPMQEMHAQQATTPAHPVYPCAHCRSPLQWIHQYQRWYCAACQQYA